jgi:hypothetical protein
MSKPETRSISSVEEALQYILDQLKANERDAEKWRALGQQFSDESSTPATEKASARKAAPKAKLASAAREAKAGTTLAKATGRPASGVPDQIVTWLKQHPNSTRLEIEKGLGRKENSLFYHLSALKQKKRIKSKGKTFGTRYSVA